MGDLYLTPHATRGGIVRIFLATDFHLTVSCAVSWCSAHPGGNNKFRLMVTVNTKTFQASVWLNGPGRHEGRGCGDEGKGEGRRL